MMMVFLKYVSGILLVDAKTGRGRIAGTAGISSSVESEPQFLFASICNQLVTLFSRANKRFLFIHLSLSYHF
jgi:hypothetical protein